MTVHLKTPLNRATSNDFERCSWVVSNIKRPWPVLRYSASIRDERMRRNSKQHAGQLEHVPEFEMLLPEYSSVSLRVNVKQDADCLNRRMRRARENLYLKTLRNVMHMATALSPPRQLHL